MSRARRFVDHGNAECGRALFELRHEFGVALHRFVAPRGVEFEANAVEGFETLGVFVEVVNEAFARLGRKRTRIQTEADVFGNLVENRRRIGFENTGLDILTALKDGDSLLCRCRQSRQRSLRRVPVAGRRFSYGKVDSLELRSQERAPHRL